MVSLLRIAVIGLILSAVIGCAIVPRTIKPIRRPVTHDSLSGSRPSIYFDVKPMGYPMHIVNFHTPMGRAHLEMTVPLLASYKNAFSAFFEVIPRGKYSDYFALVDMETMKVETSFKEVEGETEIYHGVLTFKHQVGIFDRFGGEFIETVEVDVSAEGEFDFSDPDRLLLQGTRLLEEMMVQMEHDVFKSLKDKDEQGKYRIDGR